MEAGEARLTSTGRVGRRAAVWRKFRPTELLLRTSLMAGLPAEVQHPALYLATALS
jgi:hypothetical protein